MVPTSSAAVTLAVGDALAVALMVVRGFGPEQFGVHHPGGALGQRLR
jgi:arabinose-5-phosphate isomerase